MHLLRSHRDDFPHSGNEEHSPGKFFVNKIIAFIILTVAGVITYQNNRNAIDEFCMGIINRVEQEIETALGFEEFDEIKLPLPQQLEAPDDTKMIAQAE